MQVAPQRRGFATVGEGTQDGRSRLHYDEVIVTVPVAALGRVSQQLVQADNDAGRPMG